MDRIKTEAATKGTWDYKETKAILSGTRPPPRKDKQCRLELRVQQLQAEPWPNDRRAIELPPGEIEVPRHARSTFWT